MQCRVVVFLFMQITTVIASLWMCGNRIFKNNSEKIKRFLTLSLLEMSLNYISLKTQDDPCGVST